MSADPTGQDNGRRRHPRFALNIEAQVVTDAGRFAARTRDLSRGGICFYLFRPLDLGSNFTLELSLVLGEGAMSEPLILKGRVIWCTAVQEGHQIGAAFVETNKINQDYLNMFLQFLDEGMAGSAAEGSDDADAADGGPAGGGTTIGNSRRFW